MSENNVIDIIAPATVRSAATRADFSIDVTLNFGEDFYSALAILLDWRFRGLPIQAEIKFTVKPQFYEI